MRIAAVLILLAVVLAGAVLVFLSGATEIKIRPVTAIGLDTPLAAQLANRHGVRGAAAFVEQDGVRHKVFEQEMDGASRFFFWWRNDPPAEVSFRAGKKQAPALKDGKARLIVAARSNDLLARTHEAAIEVQVITRPPSVAADGEQHYINQGGSELVTFTVSGYWTEAGVRVGKYTFRSFPLGSDENRRFSLFAYPWDTPPGTVPVVYARNPAGAEAQARFWHKVFPKNFRRRDLELPDSFLDKVTNEIDAGGSGDRVARFLKINGELRRRNNETLAGLRSKTEPRFLWDGPFVQLSNSKVESQFADIRSYLYQGKKIDEQTHLGFDLSVTANVGVAASNSGKVVLAEYLGIYGNCVVVDHGYGLQSIYAHLSKIEVKPGEAVKKGQTLGRSGATGLAGGDHLHFSMQVDGVQVNPVEWWDGHWIQDRILSKISAATPAPK